MSLLGKLIGKPDPEHVVREHGPRVHRQLRRIFGPNADVDDVFQIVFVEILRSLPSFQGRSRLSTWIRRITWNVAYQEMRLRYHHQRLVPLEEATAALSRPEETTEIVFKREAMHAVYRGLETLPPHQRLAVIMHDVEGLTLREIGESLGRPLPTVASQLHAGRKKLTAWVRQHATTADDNAMGSDVGHRGPTDRTRKVDG